MSFNANRYDLSDPDAAAKAQLRRMRFFATGLLVLVALIFVLAHVYGAYWHGFAYVKAFTEAAMVGALADWFAVVALFKRPLGLPIAHTAILPRKQAKLAAQIGVFIERNFLQGNVIANRVYRLHPAQKALAWLSQEANQRQVAQGLAAQVPTLLQQVPPELVAEFTGQILKKHYSGKALAAALAKGLLFVQAHGQHRLATDVALKQAQKWLRLEATQDMLEHNINEWVRRVKTEAPSTWDKIVAAVKGSAVDMVDDWLAKKVLAWADDYLQGVLDDPEHALRHSLDQRLSLVVTRLSRSKKWARLLGEWKDQLSDDAQFQALLASLWVSIQDWSKADVASASGLLADKTQVLVGYLCRQLAAQPRLVARLDMRLALWVKRLVNQYKSVVSQFVSDKIAAWDQHTWVQKLELSVGKELQYIRINGTLVGGLVGLVIYFVSHYLPRL
ncbi:MAG: DUF445 domain-containing protein [Neisseriaceae bacterium]|nr:DUF445 domain-containing protein [Neisseriaceae bacterium]MBP6862660.1 DUF445 domain-containing protein [Neisseriaceae bacterium]